MSSDFPQEHGLRGITVTGPGVDQSTRQPTWYYCQISGDMEFRIIGKYGKRRFSIQVKCREQQTNANLSCSNTQNHRLGRVRPTSLPG